MPRSEDNEVQGEWKEVPAVGEIGRRRGQVEGVSWGFSGVFAASLVGGILGFFLVCYHIHGVLYTVTIPTG